jgi:hypothetical protein
MSSRSHRERERVVFCIHRHWGSVLEYRHIAALCRYAKASYIGSVPELSTTVSEETGGFVLLHRGFTAECNEYPWSLRYSISTAILGTDNPWSLRYSIGTAVLGTE